MNSKEELQQLKDKYSSFIVEKTIDEIKGMCDNKELDIDSNLDKVWVVNYLGSDPAEQAEMFLNILVGSGITSVIEINPEKIFSKIFAVKDYKGQQDIIALFLDDVIRLDIIEDLYSETKEMFLLKTYLSDQLPMSNTYVKSEYDPLNFNERNKKLDEDIEKVNNGEMNIGEFLSEIGWVDKIEGEDTNVDYAKVNDIKNKIIAKKIAMEEIKKMFESGEITIKELRLILGLFFEIDEDEKLPEPITTLVAPIISKEELFMKMYNWKEGTTLTWDAVDLQMHALGGKKVDFYDLINDILNYNLTIRKDMEKVEFGLANIHMKSTMKDFWENFIVQDNQFSYFELSCNGRGEEALYFIIYWDGNDLRVYIPEDGNIYNTLTNKAFGSDKAEDMLWAETQIKDSELIDILSGTLSPSMILKDLLKEPKFDFDKLHDNVKNSIKIA